MGMFDYVRCEYPLQDGAPRDGYQSKDTPEQYMDTYEIREDGTLWHQEYDVEDHSDLAKWRATNPGKEPPKEMGGLASIAGCMSRTNPRWKQVEFHGALEFSWSNVTANGPRGYMTPTRAKAEFWTFVALYDHGMLLKIEGGKEVPDEWFQGDPVSREEFWSDLK